ncbi:MAG: cbb3-type cytochrome c oxidase N-terminal domain-containing protein [Saprospiraceae bacterium]|nr:cbb3-type cytochrome c oxidase N-terminal domain-containing protein [Saprospiraceae bacterium]
MKTIFSAALMLVCAAMYGQATPAASAQKGFTIDTNTLLIIFAVFLLLPIWILSNTFITAANRYYANRIKSGSAKVLLPLGLLMLSTSLMAQATTLVSTPGLSATVMTILLICVISAEMLLILFFASKTNDFIQKMEVREVTEAKPNTLMAWLQAKWAAMNFKPIEEEYKIDTGHNYDGIRELDNIIPSWFTTAFLLTILFGIGYLYRYHIAKSAPMQIEEYQNEVTLANLRHDEYLKTEANSIDENSVTLMTGADLEAGKKTFVTLCAACHKADGGGMVGPNLTDEYWIHGGSLKNLFTIVKYGVPDKGMISWKEQLNPQQMAQVSNYILTLKGTNPPDAKEKQGTLYVPDAVTTTDSIAAKVMQPDSTATKAIQPDSMMKK